MATPITNLPSSGNQAEVVQPIPVQATPSPTTEVALPVLQLNYASFSSEQMTLMAPGLLGLAKHNHSLSVQLSILNQQIVQNQNAAPSQIPSGALKI